MPSCRGIRYPGGEIGHASAGACVQPQPGQHSVGGAGMAKAFDAIAKRIIAATGSTRGQGLHRQAVATEESLAPLAAVVFLEGNAGVDTRQG